MHSLEHRRQITLTRILLAFLEFQRLMAEGVSGVLARGIERRLRVATDFRPGMAVGSRGRSGGRRGDGGGGSGEDALRRWSGAGVTAHCGANSSHFETSIIHFPTSEGVSEVSE